MQNQKTDRASTRAQKHAQKKTRRPPGALALEHRLAILKSMTWKAPRSWEGAGRCLPQVHTTCLAAAEELQPQAAVKQHERKAAN